MGASSSIAGVSHIHISLSTKFADNKKIIPQIVEKLEEKNIIVTITDSGRSTKEICSILKKADIIFYCSTQNYSTCAAQAIEYSYICENNTLTYNMIIDEYGNNTSYTKHIQSFLNNDGWEISSIDDFQHVLKEMNHKLLF